MDELAVVVDTVVRSECGEEVVSEIGREKFLVRDEVVQMVVVYVEEALGEKEVSAHGTGRS